MSTDELILMIKEGRIVPRKGHIQKRDVLADPLYNDKVVTRLINTVMLDGKKGVAQKIVYGAFAQVEEKSGRPALEVFEEAMNNFDLIDIHRKFFQGTDDLYDDNTCKMVVERINYTLKHIPIFLRQWLKRIDVFDVKPQFELDRDSMYLSFNYTMLLEHIYLIPENRVIHIHNCLESDAPLITGHKTTRSKYWRYYFKSE